jgi:hypothetical protein
MTKYWHSEGESPLRRYGACGPPYQVLPDRHRYPPGGLRRSTRSYALPVQEPQLPDSDQDSERDAKESRRRIPVAVCLFARFSTNITSTPSTSSNG